MNKDELISLVRDKGKLGSISKDSVEFKRFIEELQFCEQNRGMYFSFDKLLADGKKSSGNKVNSYILYLLDIVDGMPDFNKPFIFKKDWYPTRFSAPDIDMDFEYNRLVQERAEQRYGDRFIYIGTFNQWKPKAAIQNAAKFNNFCLPGQTVASTAILLSKSISKFDTSDFDAAINGEEFKALRAQYPSIEKIIEDARKICNQKNSTGKHAGGVIICDVPVHEVCPYFVVEEVIDQKKTGRWIKVSQFNDKDCENLGLLKADFLGVKTLESIHMSVDMIKARTGQEVDIEGIDVFNKEQNEQVLELFRRGVTGGIFQFEGWQITKFLMEMQPTCFDDLVAANALYRPGPKDNGYTTEYCLRKKNPAKAVPPHPSLQELLADTYGLWVYQEQLMKGAGILAGFNPTEQDELRRIIGKKDLKKLPYMKEKFISRCVVHGVIDLNFATIIWDQFEKFGNYAFNRSHCLSGDTKIYDKKTEKFYTIEELYNRLDYGNGVVLDSYLDNKIIDDEISEVLYKGEQDVFEVNFANGIRLKCTMQHKFLCSDNKFRELKEIIENKHDVLSVSINTNSLENIKSCKIINIKHVGVEPTYNITMKSKQHNYALYDDSLENIIISKNSASYAKIAYQTAFIKRYFPVEFYAATMTRELRKGSPDDENSNLLNYEKEALKFFGIKLLEPNVNYSKTFYSVEYIDGLPALRKPLIYISGVGDEAEKEIVAKQPYTSFEDFYQKQSSRVLNSKTINALIDSGALSDFGEAEFLRNEYMRCKEIRESASKKQSTTMRKMAPRMNGVL